MHARSARSFAISLAAHVAAGALVLVLARSLVAPALHAPAAQEVELAMVQAASPSGSSVSAPAPAASATPGGAKRPSRSVARAAPVRAAGVAVTSAASEAEAETPAGFTSPGLGTIAGAPPPPPGPVAAPLDGEAVRAAVQATLRYPRVARQRGLEGTVMLRLHIGSDGMVDQLEVVASAGAALDQAAEDAVRRAAPYRTGPGWVRIPVVFELGALP